MKFKDMSIAMKLAGMAASILVLTVVVGWQGLRGLNNQSIAALDMEHLLYLEVTLEKREIDHLSWASSVTSFLLDKTKTSCSAGTDASRCALGLWLSDREVMAEAYEHAPELKAIFDGMKGDHEALHQSAAQIKKILADNQNNRATSNTAMVEVYQRNAVPALAGVRDALHNALEVIEGYVRVEEAKLHAVSQKTKQIIIGFIIAAIFLGVAISYCIARLISRQIGEAVDFAESLASGDFSKSLAISQGDEIGVLARALNKIVKSLQAMVGEVNKSSSSLSEASHWSVSRCRTDGRRF